MKTKLYRFRSAIVSTIGIFSIIIIILPAIGQCKTLESTGGVHKAAVSIVSNDNELLNKLSSLSPGKTILIKPGQYSGNISIKNVNGASGGKITIKGVDPDNPPVFKGGIVSFHISSSTFLTLENLTIIECQGNGINIDDGGDFSTPSSNIMLENVAIYRIGPVGNMDGLKLSGVVNFKVNNCRFAGWGGSAIDMVGCHNGIVTNCRFQGLDWFSQHNGVQAKGGSSNILIAHSFFSNTGMNSIVIGGHTGESFFRPKGVSYEATSIKVFGNRIYGSRIPIAWGTALGGKVSYNTIVAPESAVLSIYQSQKSPEFIGCQGGEFSYNLVISTLSRVRAAKIGDGTKPETFNIAGNLWNSQSGKFIMNLPSGSMHLESNADPEISDIGTPQMRILSEKSEFRSVGAANAPALE